MAGALEGDIFIGPRAQVSFKPGLVMKKKIGDQSFELLKIARRFIELLS